MVKKGLLTLLPKRAEKMKKTFANTLTALAVLPFLMQCASQSDVEDLRYQLRIVNKKVEDMKTTTVPLQKKQAAASGQIDQMEKELLELKGQLEETHYLNQKLKDQNKELEVSISSVAQEEASKREEALRRFEDSLREKEARLAEKLNQQQESVKAIQEARVKEAERKAKETALMADLAKKKAQSLDTTTDQGAKKAAPKAKDTKTLPPSQGPSEPGENAANKQAEASVAKEKQSPPATAAPAKAAAVPAPEAADSNMKKAMKLFEKNSYAEALPLFEQIAGSSTSNEAVEARYMMGECLFNQKEYDKAIMQYQKIISQSSNHAKAPSAMFKQGMAFESLADKETAKVIYKKLAKKHGSSSEAAKAQERLKKL
jgi:tol-pal system protein YbgF